MNVDYTEDQLLLKDAVARQFSSNALEQSILSKDPWKICADAGFLGIPFAKEDGGMGAGPIESMILLEEVGRAAIQDAYLSVVVLSGEILRQVRYQPLVKEWISKIIEGTFRFALAYAEAESAHDPLMCRTVAYRCDGGWRLSGEKVLVHDVDEANLLIVVAKADTTAPSLFVVDPVRAGVSIRTRKSWDGRSLGSVNLVDVFVPDQCVLGEHGKAAPLVNRALDFAIAGVCAEAFGAMSGSFDLTVRYLKGRQRFNRELGNYHSVQYMVADMVIALELARSAAIAAAAACANSDAVERHRAVARGKVQINRSGRFIRQCAMQLTGVIGFVEEGRMGRYFKRLTVIEQMFGDDLFHLRYLAN